MELQHLQQQYEGILGKSVIQGIYESNPQQAKTILDELSNQNPEIGEQAKKRMEEDFARQFQTLDESEIQQALSSVKYNEDLAVMALLDLVETKARASKQHATRQREHEAARVKEEALQQVAALFENVPKEELQQLLDLNFGNVERTIDVLLQRIQKGDEENQRRRQAADLASKLKIDEAKAYRALEQHQWESDKALAQLSKEIISEKYTLYSKMFPDLDGESILSCLGFDDSLNRKKLQALREVKKLKDKEEEERREKRIQEMQREETERRERASRDRQLEEEKLRREHEAKTEEERRAHEERTRAEETRRAEEERARQAAAESKERQEEAARAQKQEAERVAFEESSRRRIEEVALRQSVLVTKIIEAENVKESVINEKVNQQIRMNLNSILRPAVGQQPGVIPKQKAVERKQVEMQGSDIGGPSESAPKPDIKIETSANSSNADAKIVKLEVKSKAVDWGKIVILHWEHSVAATTSDWIGLYKRGEPSNQQYITWEYITMENNSAKSGSKSFNAPSFSGEFEFRYFTYGTYNIFGVSEPFKVGPQFELIPEVVSPNSIRVSLKQLTESTTSFKTWLALYSSEKQTHQEFYAYHWTQPQVPTTFAIPKCGKWYFRLFTNKCRYDYVTGCEAFIEGKDEILLSQTSDSLVVQFDIKSVDLTYESPWLGIYRKDEVLQNMYEQYKYLAEVKGEFLMAKLRYATD